MLYFGGWEFEGLGNDKYTFENGILRDSDGDEIEIRNVEPFHKLKTRKDVNLANALSLVNRVFIESGIRWRVYKADLNFNDGGVQFVTTVIHRSFLMVCGVRASITSLSLREYQVK